jgi:hypothetical protein
VRLCFVQGPNLFEGKLKLEPRFSGLYSNTCQFTTESDAVLKAFVVKLLSIDSES